MTEALLADALIKAGPIGIAILATGFIVAKYIIPSLKDLAEHKAKLAAADFDRAEAARQSRDAAWQASLRDIGQSHKEATTTAVGGFKEALDRHDKVLDRYAQQHQVLATDVAVVKTDVASMRSDLHSVVSKLTTLDGIPVVKVKE